MKHSILFIHCQLVACWYTKKLNNKMRKSKAKNKQLRQRQESVKHLLAESREVERKEKAASTTKNEDLFVIDTAAPKKKQQISETVQQAASQEKKKQLQKQIKLFDPMHMLQEKYGDSLLKPLGKDLPTPTPTSLAQTKKRKREEEVEDARKAKRARKQQQSTEAKKPAVFDLWAADAPVKASKKHRQSTAKVELVKPHAGQSYNPTESAHQEAIEMAYEGELELYMRAKSIKKQLSYDENHPAVASGTGDDVLDGFNMQDKVDEVEDLTQDNATTELHQKILTRKKKISREKKRNVNKHKKQIRQRVERMKNATTPQYVVTLFHTI